MEKEFIPYEQALALKELGFDEPCFGLYHNDKTFYPTQCKSHEQFHGQTCSALLYQQAFCFFREKHGVLHDIDFGLGWGFGFIPVGTQLNLPNNFTEGFDTYEEAELACLKKLIELCKKN
jgi:hypothetical protein